MISPHALLQKMPNWIDIKSFCYSVCAHLYVVAPWFLTSAIISSILYGALYYLYVALCYLAASYFGIDKEDAQPFLSANLDWLMIVPSWLVGASFFVFIFIIVLRFAIPIFVDRLFNDCSLIPPRHLILMRPYFLLLKIRFLEIYKQRLESYGKENKEKRKLELEIIQANIREEKEKREHMISINNSKEITKETNSEKTEKKK